jgi:DNA-binding beta-propeller fold protein YncE
VIDTATNTVIDTITVDNNPFAVAVSPDGSLAYVTNGGGTVSVISFGPTTPPSVLA